MKNEENRKLETPLALKSRKSFVAQISMSKIGTHYDVGMEIHVLKSGRLLSLYRCGRPNHGPICLGCLVTL
jgi:hypothetical protein